jgi:hypothetical protein
MPMMRSLTLFIAMGALPSAVLGADRDVAPVLGAAIYVAHDQAGNVEVFNYRGDTTADLDFNELNKTRTVNLHFTENDAIASGDVTGDGLAEILVAGDVSRRIDIFDQSGKLIRSFGADFNRGNGFAVGDVNGDGNAELLVAHQSDNNIVIFDQFGNRLSAFDHDFDEGDGFAVGVDGDGRPEILVAHHNIEAFDQFGNLTHQFGRRFSKGNGFAVGDLDGDGRAEILVAHQDSKIIEVLKQRPGGIVTVSVLPTTFSNGNGFAVGDVDGDGRKEEILVAHQHDHNIEVFNQDGALISDFAGRFNPRNGFAIEHSGRDSDGDGLLDAWEMNGLMDANGNLIVDANGNAVLPAGRANPMHKDLFLEMDWMPGQAPTRAAIATLTAAFAAAPFNAGGIPNPDGLPGINLFVDTGSLSDAMGLVGNNFGGGNQLPATPAVVCLNANFYLMKNGRPASPGSAAIPAQFDPNRAKVFRYAISGDPATMPPCVGGRAEIGGNDFIEYNHNAGTIMHELGHTLGLRHGGNEHVPNCKPNYISVMNYNYQNGIGRAPGAGTPIIDYSPPRTTFNAASNPQWARGKTPLPTLNERSLDENMILDMTDTANQFIFYRLLPMGMPPIPTLVPFRTNLNANPDYDNDDSLPGGGLSSNLMIDIDMSPLCPGQNIGLNRNITGGFDDWSNIALNFHKFGDSANAGVNTVTEVEPSLEDFIAFERELNRNEITTSFGITRSGFRYNPATQRFVQHVTLQNISASPMFGPISLVLDSLSNNASLANKTGVTANFAPLDSPFVTVNIGADNVLSPQESVTVTLEFGNPTNAGIAYSTRVLAGDLPP